MWPVESEAANHAAFVTDDPKFPRASRVAIQLLLTGTTETFQIGQTDARIRPMLDQCAIAIVENQPDDALGRARRAERFHAFTTATAPICSN